MGTVSSGTRAHPGTQRFTDGPSCSISRRLPFIHDLDPNRVVRVVAMANGVVTASVGRAMVGYLEATARSASSYSRG